ncbi:pyridoxal phosphate-dependent aminotransferase [Clostridium fallax]|uniref:L-threonine O-3-phosphate decarboxylase n=1 Tax=Clostridium fallax TaxID=1533 RepID=A0A1M4SJP9_9CLOT|nr:histidinol-phosphate transaminase [Clostridium fallax]SHE32426.1 L-threonine O-3-phosphate decarboxylase [Clostridium fallax]SQB07859.1 aminotransferase [Clostridium fallax]
MTINHGANLFDLANKLGFKETEFMDFSSNINPFGSSIKAKKAVINNINMVSIYPDPEYKKLKASISEYCICKKENIILGSGATELISSFIKTINPKKTLLLSPAYSEYEHELKKINSTITKYFSNEFDNFKININDIKTILKNENYDLIIICNPNNPTGFAFTKEEIKYLLKDSNAFVMIDETYIEFTKTSEFSSTSLVDNFENLFVIRGTSKFFSTPGIRLGYGLISNKNILNKIYEHLDLWNINIFASIMGEIMFKDKDYINLIQNNMETEREYLLKELNEVKGLKVFHSNGNFILCKIDNEFLTAKNLYNKLLHKKIIIRDCTSFEGLDKYFFRVCILKPNENKLLIKELKNIFNENK